MVEQVESGHLEFCHRKATVRLTGLRGATRNARLGSNCLQLRFKNGCSRATYAFGRKIAFSRLAPVHWTDLEGRKRVSPAALSVASV
jgi:hypothetical protein